jgi:hypothetical protein
MAAAQIGKEIFPGEAVAAKAVAEDDGRLSLAPELEIERGAVRKV